MPDSSTPTALESRKAGAANGDLVLDLEGVGKRYREGEAWRDVLQGLGLQMRRGAIGALLGRSGAGKSTLLNLISGIDSPDAGTVTVDGVEIGGLSERDRTLFRRRHVGFVFQFYNLVPTLTVAENVRFLLDLDGADSAASRAAELLREVGLEDRAGAFPDRLSGGEQQRVAIARALA
ncbi:ABC transporter ATP-binding protein, partial [Rubrivirga sp.]|uniref:ABC transporter ATP-binding protein n=1 Tax=Rubrivirga sp. TaxID=1885344 RepID=UPI003C766B78